MARFHGQATEAAQIGTGEIATAMLAAGAVTDAKLGTAPMKRLVGTGHAGAGACTLTGAVVGDRVRGVFGAPTAGGALVEAHASFEAAITVADQIQQSSASDLHLNTYVVDLLPAAA